MIMLLSWVVASCRLICGYQGFGEAYCHQLQGWSPIDGKYIFSEKVVSTCESICCHNPEEQQHHENLKSYNVLPLQR
jgi:hypothetical protein